MTRADEEIDDTINRLVGDDGEPTPPDDAEAGPEKVAAAGTRGRLTGVELEARFDDWRTEQRSRREVRTQQDGARTVRRGLGAVMGAGILALLAASAARGNGFEASRAENSSRVTTLQQQLADAQAVPGDTDVAGKMTALSAAAGSDAGKVAQAQQTYAVLYHSSSTQPDTDNGAPNEAMVATAEHRRALAPLFSQDSYLVDDEDAYIWQNVVPFDAARQIDPRFAWYVRYQGWQASDPSKYTWKVETVMPDLGAQDASGATNTAKVIWLCRDTQTHDVLAWASAVYTYEGTSGVFDDLEVVVTTAGAAHQYPTSTKPDGPAVPQLHGARAQTKGPK